MIEQPIQRESGKTSLQITGISKSFGGNEVLRKIDLRAAEGEFLSLLGPSGCGKTTTLNIIAGFISPDSGEIIIDGQIKTKVPPHKRNLAMVFQNYSLFPHMTVYGNIAFGLQMQNLDKKSIDHRVMESLAMVHLKGMESRFPRQLSGGQQQRVGLARAVAVRPRVLLLDEPLSNLDAKLRKAMQVELRSIQEMIKITTIYVTHDQEEALTLSDRILVMNQGMIEQDGSPKEIYGQPRTEFVADFLGVTNFFDAIVKNTTSDLSIVEILSAGRINIKSRTSLSEGQRIRLAIRPDRVSLQPVRKSSDNDTILTGVVSSQVFIGSYDRLEIMIGNDLPLIVYLPTEQAERFAIGMDVQVDVMPEDWLVLAPTQR